MTAENFGRLYFILDSALEGADDKSSIALMKDLRAQMQDVQARLERLDSKDLEVTRRLSALDHKYVSIAGITDVVKNNQLETEKLLLASMSQRPAR